MSLTFLAPITISDAQLISSTRAEDDYAAWNSGTTYAQGDRVILTSTHRIYESVQSGNTNHNPATDDGIWWVDVGPTTRWAMFDRAVGTVTSVATPLTVVLAPGIVSALALLDVDGTSVQVSVLDAPGGSTVYDQSFDLSDTARILDWWMYFFDPIVPRTTLIVNDLPPYSTARITVTVVATTTASCGTLAAGDMIEVGDVLHGAGIGIIDYSRKETDIYGVTTVVERAYAKRAELPILIDNTRIDYAAQKLAGVRATPCVWVADDRLESMIIYGWLRDWSINIAYPTVSEASITIEGLT